MHRNVCWSTLLWITLLAACATAPAPQPTEQTLSPDLAARTAIVASKFTQAAQLTLQPMTALPAEPFPIPTEVWIPSPNDGVTASDNGKSFEIGITSRISIILDARDFPMTDLRQECDPVGVLGRVSNIPPVPWPFYVVRFEGVQLGKCAIHNRQFQVTLAVVDHQ
jgi:hypothetical protein